MSEEEKLNQVWDAVANSIGTEIFDKINVPGTFIGVVVKFLLFEKRKPVFQVEAGAIGLCNYGAFDEDDLKAVGRGDYDKFRESLSAEGVPKAICDLLFDKYVAPAQSTEPPSIEEVCDAYIQKHVKLEKLPELENFELSQDSPFKMFAREDVKVPKMPDKAGSYKDWPYMLFHGLSELEVKEVEEKEAEKKEAGVKT
eukprot:CAMPEP_0184540496 /NCGR_PEP_ID=MMETSP0199_2-20130426/655_1 /TAXON_ID=1112570 /ORGANISM="Thraustochytrium sp., Strain LLF1b" /LENGTH=197 /DNA_ID=CAMNT_0026934097 /DNA_START=25 /DNA_END=615 /DNA_ORIENTATION=+